MNLDQRLALSFYEVIATLNEAHKVYIVQHRETKKIYVKKILDIYNMDVYEVLYNHHIQGTPKLICFCEENGRLTLIEEYISGDSIKEKIDDASLSIEDILQYTLDLCDIVEKLHSADPAIIHRDIKPSNIIINDAGHAILLDFNASKYYSPSADEDTVLLGTAGYAAPEQYGFGSSSPQTDIFSLGVLLNEMLKTVQVPDDTETKDLISSLEEISQKCTQMDPASRFENVAALRKALISCPAYDKLSSVLGYYPYGKSGFDTLLAAQNAEDSPRRFLPPGFRTRNPWKMFIASAGYIFVGWLCLSTNENAVISAESRITTMSLFIILIIIIFVTFDYLGIHKYMPFYKHRSRFLRFLGLIIFNTTIFLASILMLALAHSLIFQH